MKEICLNDEGTERSLLFITIRNITGSSCHVETARGVSCGGALWPADGKSGFLGGSGGTGLMLMFNANKDENSYGNPMAGHAVATDNDGGIRPYNISMIPIIIVS